MLFIATFIHEYLRSMPQALRYFNSGILHIIGRLNTDNTEFY